MQLSSLKTLRGSYYDQFTHKSNKILIFSRNKMGMLCLQDNSLTDEMKGHLMPQNSKLSIF